MPDGSRKNEMNIEDVKYSVHTVDTLGWSDDATAQRLLQQAVKLGNVLLKRHRWTVVRVSEFWPRNKSLLGLNVNMGEHIKVRMRYPDNKNRFYAFEEIMCTLIHEIVHCTIGPHNQEFWKRYYELVAEAEVIGTDMGMGTSVAEGEATAPPAPQPFGGQGRRLGDGSKVSSTDVTTPGVTPFSGQGRALGGTVGSGARVESADRRRQVMLDALQKRHPELRIPAGAAEPVGRRSRLLEVAAQRPEEAGDCGLSQCARGSCGEDSAPKARKPFRTQPSASDADEAAEASWQCPRCSFLNHPLLPFCEMCCQDATPDDDGRARSLTPPDLHAVPAATPMAQRGPAAAAAGASVVDSDDDDVVECSPPLKGGDSPADAIEC